MVKGERKKSNEERSHLKRKKSDEERSHLMTCQLSRANSLPFERSGSLRARLRT